MQPMVLKFGGTSVEDAAAMGRLSQIVKDRLTSRPVVVVSALRGVTDALLQSVRCASEGDPEAGMALLTPQLQRHVLIAEDTLNAAEQAAIQHMVADARDEIGNLLRIVKAHPGTRLPLQDEIVSYGERLSARLTAAILRAVGGREVDARRCILTDDDHTSAVPIAGPTREQTRAELLPLIEHGIVPVLGGFIAAAASGATTTLGRGGSDYSAAVFGAALEASEIQIWTDVTGFLTADPRVVPGCPAAGPALVYGGRRARVLRGEGPAPEDDSAGRRDADSRADLQLEASGAPRNAHQQRAERARQA